MNKLLVLALALGSFAACAPPATTINITPGDGGDGGSGGAGASGTTSSTTAQGGSIDNSAHGYYVATVHPSLIATCGGCHNPDGQVGAPAFLDYDAELSYPITKGYPNIVKDPASSSILIMKGPHEGPGVSADQKAIIQTWISMELTEAGAGGGGMGGAGGSTSTGPMTLEDMLTGFAACMDYDIWLSSGMDKFPLQQTNGDGPCMSCHNTGVGATYLNGDPQDTFDNNKLFPFIMRLVKPVYEGSTPVDLVASDRFFNKGKEPCQNPPICHPKFDLTPENKAALENFVSTTLTKWQSGQCGKP
jgi:cytochrome c553